MLSTALTVYVTDARLNSTGVGLKYGFIIADKGLGSEKFNVNPDGAAIGVADDTTTIVMSLLRSTETQAVCCILYRGDATKRSKARDVFATINQAAGI